MHYKYIIALYVDKDGNKPVEQYLFDGRNETDYSMIINRIQSLAIIGQEIVDNKRAKKFENSIYELRVGDHRIIYTPDGIRFILLSAFLKNTQKTQYEEIKRFRAYFADYLENRRYFDLRLPPLNF